MMRYIKKRLICMAIIAMLFATSIPIKAQENFDFTWKGDYTNMELVLSIESPVKYLQQVIAVMYDATIEEPTVTDYVRIAEITLTGNEDAEIRFKISNDLTAIDGRYKVSVQGNGIEFEESKANKEVTVLTPERVDPANPSSLLYILNTATKDSVLTPVKEMANALQIEVGESESEVRRSAFVNIRNKDNAGGKFASVNAAADAWKVSEVVEYLEGNSTADGLKTKFKTISEILGIDLESEDYKSHEADVYSNIIVLKNGGTASGCCAELKAIFEQAQAISVLNRSTTTNIASNLKKYYHVFGITSTDYTKYTGCSKEIREKIERQLVAQNFSTIIGVKDKFDTALGELTATNSGSTPDLGSDGDSGSGGFSGGSGGLGSKSDKYTFPEESTTNQKVTFTDCNDSHWAYECVESLKEAGIISGYPDGKFYPERTINREEFVKMVINAADLFEDGKECEFKDVSKTEWHYKYIASAYSAKIIDGIGEGKFGIGESMKREDVAVIIYRILHKIGKAEDVTEYESSFADSEDISDYAIEGITTLSNMGVLNGFEDGSFRPKNYLTRAEAAKVLFELRKVILQ